MSSLKKNNLWISTASFGWFSTARLDLIGVRCQNTLLCSTSSTELTSKFTINVLKRKIRRETLKELRHAGNSCQCHWKKQQHSFGVDSSTMCFNNYTMRSSSIFLWDIRASPCKLLFLPLTNCWILFILDYLPPPVVWGTHTFWISILSFVFKKWLNHCLVISHETSFSLPVLYC